MAARYILPRGTIWLGACILVLSGLFVLAGAAQKMKPAELLAKHLASIGTPEARAAVHNRLVTGVANVLLMPAPEIRNTVFGSMNKENRADIAPKAARQHDGNVVLVSEGESVRFGLRFSAPDYAGEDLACDGKTLRTHVYGRLSVPVEFIREGLLGGTLTTAWVLLDHAGGRPRLQYKGLKKLGGREYHELQYPFRKDYGNRHVVDIRAHLYFDPQTFRHVQTQCRIVEISAITKGTKHVIHTLTEEFGDFAVAGGLTLPRTYKLCYSREDNRHITTTEWNVAIEEIRHNQQLDPRTFVMK
jgi:hypothetical protein